MKSVIVGKTYKISHSRKGNFQMLVTSTCEIWATGFVTKGKAKAMLDYNEKEVLDEITIRHSHFSFSDA